MAIKRIIASGCSFTYGQGLDNPSTESWPAQLSNMFNVPCINLGYSGAGNDFIISEAIDYSIKNLQESDLFIIAFSQWSRYTFTNMYNKIVHLNNTHRNKIDLADLLYGSYYNEEFLYKKYLRQIIQLQSYFEHRKIQYFMFEAIAQMHVLDCFYKNTDLVQQVNRKTFLNFTLDNFSSLTNPKDVLPDGHPNAQAHKDMAGILYQNLININS